MEQELLELERDGWRALSAGADQAAAFYRATLRDDAVMLFPGGLRLTGKPAILASLGAQPWSRFQIDDPAVIALNSNAGVLIYRAHAQRGHAAPYTALISSTYVREGGAWRLVLHQQTPL